MIRSAKQDKIGPIWQVVDQLIILCHKIPQLVHPVSSRALREEKQNNSKDKIKAFNYMG